MEVVDEGCSGTVQASAADSSPEVQIELDRAALKAILSTTLKEIADIEEECMFIVDIMTRKKFKTLAESRPATIKERKKRKNDVGPTPSSAKKAKFSSASAATSNQAQAAEQQQSVNSPSAAADGNPTTNEQLFESNNA